MKTLLALITLIPTLAFADPTPPAAGTFSFDGNFRVIQLRKAELVRLDTEAGKKRLAELRQQGRECVAQQGSLVRCVGFENTEGAESAVTDKVNNQLSGAAIKFGKLEGGPSQDIKAPTYEEWSVMQAVEFFGKKWGGYRFMILSGELEKIALGNPTETSVIVRGEKFGYVFNIQRQESRDVILTYMIEAELAR